MKTVEAMDKKAAAQMLEQIASFLELRGENPFRIRAFRAAARSVGSVSGDLPTALEDGSLAGTKGIGPATLQIITELATTGRASLLEELREQIPAGLVEMLAISGLGIARIRQIHEVLGIDSLPELEAAAMDGRLAKLPRFGQKTSENILRGIAYLRQASTYRLSHHAAEEAEGLRSALLKLPGVLQAFVAVISVPLRCVMRSPGFTPALCAGLPGITRLTRQGKTAGLGTSSALGAGPK